MPETVRKELLKGEACPGRIPDQCVLDIAAGLATAILLLEYYDPAAGLILTNIASSDEENMRNRDTIEGCVRMIVRFFSKRPVLAWEKCTVKRSLPKTAMCDNCKQRKARCDMMI